MKFLFFKSLLILISIPFQKSFAEIKSTLSIESHEINAAGLSSRVYHAQCNQNSTLPKGDFYPRHGHQFTGFAAALCGGSWPTHSPVIGGSEVDKIFPLFVRISKKDFLFEQVEAGLKKYAQLGFPLRTMITNEDGHCAFDIAQSIEQINNFQMK